MENKTVREWYNLLIHPYNKLAVLAVLKENDFDVDKSIAYTINDALNMFTWASNPVPYGTGLKPWSYVNDHVEEFMISPYSKYLKSGAKVEVITRKITP